MSTHHADDACFLSTERDNTEEAPGRPTGRSPDLGAVICRNMFTYREGNSEQDVSREEGVRTTLVHSHGAGTERQASLHTQQ
jgi:hypothetical protein